MYKLIAIDVDGTLINDQREITKEVKEAIQTARSLGVKVVICTGRPIKGAEPFIEELQLNDKEDFVITFNGALVQNTNTNEIVSENSLTYNELDELYQLSCEISSPMHFFDSDRMYTPNKAINKYTVYESYANQLPLYYQTLEETPKNILAPKAMFIDEPERLETIIQKIPDTFKEKYTMIQSTPFFLEIMHPNVNKGSAVKQLANKLSIKREDIICIGDGDNDLTMIEYAGCGVAMENATEKVKELADFHTLSNNENGVANAIEKLVLQAVRV